MIISAARLSFLTATPAGAAALLGTAFSGHPSAAATAAVSVAWSALVTVGVFSPRLQMFGDILNHGPPDRPEVALTFDDGPNRTTTRQVLSMLSGTAHRATFFVLAEKVRRDPEILREICSAGHGLGLHGDTHDRMHAFRRANTVFRELLSAQATIQSVVGFRPRWFRPPIGHTSPSTMLGARRAGVVVVGWSSRGYDGLRHRSPTRALTRIQKTLRPGSIVLLHDASERDDFEPASLSLLPTLLSDLDARRLVSRRLDDWF